MSMTKRFIEELQAQGRNPFGEPFPEEMQLIPCLECKGDGCIDCDYTGAEEVRQQSVSVLDKEDWRNDEVLVHENEMEVQAWDKGKAEREDKAMGGGNDE